jgi:DNA-damage-inducible protein J
VIPMPDKTTPSELEVPNAKTAAAMQEARQGGLPSFDTVDDLMADLNAEKGQLPPPIVPAGS